MESDSTANRTERLRRLRYLGSMCPQIHSAQTVRMLRQRSAGGGRDLFATISAFWDEPSRAGRALSFSYRSVNNEESGPIHEIWQTPGNHFNGSSISTLLEGYCRESIKRPIGRTHLCQLRRRCRSVPRQPD